METNSVAEVLRALAKGDKARSETARLRDIFGEVEAALNAGVSRAAVLEALHGQGFTMTPKSFESALYRIRKQRGKQTRSATPPGVDKGRNEAVENPASQQGPEEKPTTESESGPKITNPNDIRKARSRKINLDDYLDQ